MSTLLCQNSSLIGYDRSNPPMGNKVILSEIVRPLPKTGAIGLLTNWKEALCLLPNFELNDLKGVKNNWKLGFDWMIFHNDFIYGF